MSRKFSDKVADKLVKYTFEVEAMYDYPFKDIIAKIPEEYLEDAVVNNFSLILRNLRSYDYKYLKIFPRWKKLLCKNLEFVLSECVTDHKLFLETFPEYSAEIYEFLFEEAAVFADFSHGFDTVEDILIPMAYLERWENCHFSIVRKLSNAILETTFNEYGYAKMWDVLYVLENEFNIPHESFEEYLNENYSSFVNCFLIVPLSQNRHIYNNGDFKKLSEFFRQREAYEFFLEEMPRLLRRSGLELYTLLIKVLGPQKEILELHDSCAEFLD